MESFLNWEYMPLIPPLLTLILVVVTRKVGISLGAGIITSAFVIANGQIGEFFTLVVDSFLAIFIEDGGLNTWNAYILIFLTLLGIMTAFMNMSGGARAFTNWALTKVKSRRGAGLMTGMLGIIVFIDDYFSALIVGQVAKPITDKYKISRAKLAYLVDTTASPVAVMSPVSSWGAGIMGLTAPLLIGAGMTHISPFQSFMYMIPMNFYVIAAIVMMFIVIF
ncbi:Na+/H+ antiporter NhaC family protein [Jeotgalicoccus sp. WY2]|uniref:Na+/H+ antiporter NhaC family protein n=1 Tax=Jeotgalicoccus sp. WY2 TaxID=2708346 RepID=UPI001BD2CF30